MHNKPQSQSQTQNHRATYENVEDIASKRKAIAEIEMKSNEAYGPVRQKQISTKANKAYGHVQLWSVPNLHYLNVYCLVYISFAVA